MLKRLKAIFNPEQFQGWSKRKNYFEGWYYKFIDAGEQHAFAVIPGINMDKKGKRHAFIQVLDGKKLSSVFHKFDYSLFKPVAGKFEVSIDNNHFSGNYIELDLPEFKGRLNFSNTVPWPKPFYSPGIMGPYTFVPFMECYHGIVSMNHNLNGILTINGAPVSFNEGHGYIEKDWGSSFPSAYFWLQCNHFTEPGISIKSSVAKIPWLNGSFVGFICGIWLKDKLVQFTTYNGSKLTKSYADKDVLELEMKNKNYHLNIIAQRDKATALASPIKGDMEGRIEESMNATVSVTLKDLKNDKIVFKDTGRNTALEVAGAIEALFI